MLAADRRRPLQRAPSLANPWPSLFADLPTLAALGLAIAAYQVCYFRAVTLVGVAPAALLAICSAPLLIAVLAALFLRESALTQTLGWAIARDGGRRKRRAARGRHAGIRRDRGPGLWAGGASRGLGAGVSYAVYAVAAKGLLARVTPLAVAAIVASRWPRCFSRPRCSARPRPRARAGGGLARCGSTWGSDPPRWPT